MFYYFDSLTPSQPLVVEPENLDLKQENFVERISKPSRPFHFTPPDEDLSDENPKLKKKPSEKIKEKTNSQKKIENPKEKKEDEFFSDKSFLIEAMEQEEEETEKKSFLSSKFKNLKPETVVTKILVQVENTKSKIIILKKKRGKNKVSSGCGSKDERHRIHLESY
jgi:hypothetical protein